MSRADYERRKRSAQCPECGKHFSPQGLNGHLRFNHGQGAATVTKTKEKAQRVGAIASRATQTMQLTQQLKQLREQRKQVEEMDESGLFSADKAVTAAKAALNRSEHELVNELRKLAGQAPLTDDGEEPEESDDDDSEDDDD